MPWDFALQYKYPYGFISCTYCRPNTDRPFIGTEVLKEVVGWCPDLEYPDRAHAQKLRTYLATTCQVIIKLNIIEWELEHNKCAIKYEIRASNISTDF